MWDTSTSWRSSQVDPRASERPIAQASHGSWVVRSSAHAAVRRGLHRGLEQFRVVPHRPDGQAPRARACCTNR